MKLNLGCGAEKIEGYVNVDIDPAMNPDQVWDFRYRFPLQDGEVEKVVMYHVIEHISRYTRPLLLQELNRVLQPEGEVIFTYPEFIKCVENWKTNYRGQRDFWEATIYGRQASPSDYHVAIMDTDEFALELVKAGFEVTFKGPEPVEIYNSVIKCKKESYLHRTYEQVLKETIFDAK